MPGAGATRPGSPGWAGPGTRWAPIRPPRRGRPGPREPASAPWSCSSRSAPSAKTTGLRTISGHRSRLSRSQPATRTSGPAATARTCTPATTAAGPVSPVPRSRGAMRTSTSPPPAPGQRRGRNKAVNSPPRLAPAAVTHSQAPPAGGCRPARASTFTFSSATTPTGIAHLRRSPALRGSAVMTVLLLSSWPSGWSRPGGCRAVRLVRRARAGGPGRDRRRRSALGSRPRARPGPGPRPVRALPDLTPPAESSVDAAGPGRKASRTSLAARNTAGAARCGRSAPPAAARDPRRRPARRLSVPPGRAGRRRPW